MKWSYSRVDCFNKCPYQFKLRYLDKLKTIDEFKSDDALRLGTAAHDAVENGIEYAIEKCISQYPISSDQLEAELLKIELIIPKVVQMLPKNGNFEVPIADSERFIGYIDYLYLKEDGTYGILDFKYTKDMRYYNDSKQIHIYKYYVEKLFGYKVSEIGYLHIPKTGILQKKTETPRMFQNRIREVVGSLNPRIVSKEYDSSAIEEFWKEIGTIENTKNFTKNEQFLCKYCEYEDLCKSKDEWKMLPKNYQRQNNMLDAHRRVWIYGAPFSGKSTLANNFSKPYFFSTDGNAKLLDAPFELLADNNYKEGRILKTDFGWTQFKTQIDELETGDYDVDTIVIDLIDDLYKLCENYVCDKLKIDDVSDAGYGKGWNMLRSEFLPTMKKLLTLDYDVVLISHEDSSKNITKRNGDEYTSIKPNLNEKVALKIAGMVDVVIRTQKIGDEYLLSFASDSVVFGGGRLGIKDDELPNDIKSIDSIFGGKQVVKSSRKEVKRTRKNDEELEEVVENESSIDEEKPVSRRSRKSSSDEETKPSRRRRKTPELEEIEEVDDEEDDVEEVVIKKSSRRPRRRTDEQIKNVQPEDEEVDDIEDYDEEKPVSRRSRKSVDKKTIDEEDWENIPVDDSEDEEVKEEATSRPRRRSRSEEAPRRTRRARG